MRGIFFIIIGIFSLFLISCENEIGRMNLEETNNQSITFELKKDKEVSIWTEIDIEYKNEPLFVYDFEFYKGEEFLMKGGTDPLTATNKRDEFKTIKDSVIHWKFYGKVEGSFIPKEDGQYTFKSTLVKNNPPDLKIHKMDIVFVE